MKPHPRIRKTVKWGGAVVSVALVVVWIGSGWWLAEARNGRGTSLLIANGQVELGWSFGPADVQPDAGWAIERLAPAFAWGFFWVSAGDERVLALPLWLPVSLSFVIIAAAWRLDTLARRRARAGICPKCSYDRTGLVPGTVCPECGAAP